MNNPIEHPKVFISYAWGDKDYQNEVLAFSSKLVRDGIEVVIDKWNLSEGNNTYAYMEKCVTDPTITNVLMLLDPKYAEKADSRSGGVGAETQIISAQVYQKVEQTKFIPIVMRREEDGSICKPTYLQSILHFDLTNPEEYDDTYQRLVRKLYGVDSFKKPLLGKKPSWVDQQPEIHAKLYPSTDVLKGNVDLRTKGILFAKLLDEIKDELVAFANNKTFQCLPDQYLQLFDNTEETRNGFLKIISNSSFIESSAILVASFFEDLLNKVYSLSSFESEIVRIRIHEMFIYTIAIFLKNKDYQSAGYLLKKTYFSHDYKGFNNGADGYGIFYSTNNRDRLDKAINNRDKKEWLTGTGQHWIETVPLDYCSSEQFIFADLICYNYMLYGNDSKNSKRWFPLTYIFCNEYDNDFTRFVKRLISYEHVNNIIPLFGFTNVDSFVEKVRLVESDNNNRFNKCRFSGAFQSAPIICEIIKADQIAMLP